MSLLLRLVGGLCCGAILCTCQPKQSPEGNVLQQIVEQDTFLRSLVAQPELEIQIIYTRIDRDAANQPSFTTFQVGVDSNRYFYPASTVKLPAVWLSLEKLNALHLSRNAVVFHDSTFSGQLSVLADSTAPEGLPTFAHYMRKILVTSDNDAYNRLYEFLGRAAFNQRLAELGYSARIYHRLERPVSEEENRHTEAIRVEQSGKTIWTQPGLYDSLPLPVLPPVLKGRGYLRGDSIVQQPFDFTYKNFWPLTSQQAQLRALIFPTSVPAAKRIRISEDDRRFLLQYMSQLPSETRWPNYAGDTAYYDAYCKFLMFGESREPMPVTLRIYNKVGDAYGYLIDNAYIVDFESGIEFMLSAVIHVNQDQIYNDSQYDYHTLGFPFMAALGKAVMQYERSRLRKHMPDLSAFQFVYGEPENSSTSLGN